MLEQGDIQDWERCCRIKVITTKPSRGQCHTSLHMLSVFVACWRPVSAVVRLLAGVRGDGAPAAAPDQRPRQRQRPGAPQVPLETLRGVFLCTHQLQAGMEVFFLQVEKHLKVAEAGSEALFLLQGMLVHMQKHAEEESELEP